MYVLAIFYVTFSMSADTVAPASMNEATVVPRPRKSQANRSAARNSMVGHDSQQETVMTGYSKNAAFQRKSMWMALPFVDEASKYRHNTGKPRNEILLRVSTSVTLGVQTAAW